MRIFGLFFVCIDHAIIEMDFITMGGAVIRLLKEIKKSDSI